MNYENLDLAILKTILTNKKYAIEFSHDCSEKLFNLDLWKFAKTILEYVKVYKETPTKRIIVEKIRQSKNEALLKYISETYDKVEAYEYSDKEYPFDLEKLKNRYSEKLINGLKEKLNGEEQLDLKKNIVELQTTLNNIKGVNSVKAFKEGTIQDYIKDFNMMYKAKLDDPNYGVGITTGFSFLDSINNGFRPGEVGLIGGITSAGKSILLGNLAVQMWLGENNLDRTDNFRKGANVLIISLEISYNDYWDRIMSRICMVPQKSLANATLTDAEKEKVSKLFKFAKTYPFKLKVIDIPKLTVESLELIINNEISLGNKFDVVVIDYMNLIKPPINNNEQSDWLQQSYISEEIHTLARKMELVILSAVQVNPKKEKSNENGGFGIQNIRRATQIIDNADLFMVIQSRTNEKHYSDLMVEILKNRRGMLSTGRLQKNLECCAFTEMQGGADNQVINDIDDISGLIE